MDTSEPECIDTARQTRTAVCCLFLNLIAADELVEKNRKYEGKHAFYGRFLFVGEGRRSPRKEGAKSGVWGDSSRIVISQTQGSCRDQIL